MLATRFFLAASHGNLAEFDLGGPKKAELPSDVPGFRVILRDASALHA